MTDIQIVTRLKNRDKSALSDLYDAYGAAFYGQLLTILDSAPLALETLQKIFLRIWNNIDQYDDRKGKLFTWMYRIVRSEANAMKHSSSKATSLSENSDIQRQEDPSSGEEPDDTGVTQLLNLLEEDNKDLVHLIYFQGYTHPKVAELTQTPLITVKTKARQGLLKLRSFLIKE